MSTACSKWRTGLVLAALLLTGTTVAATTGSLGIDVNVFVPKPEKWINGTLQAIKDFKVMPGIDLISKTLVLGFFVMGFLKHWPSRNMAAIFRSLMLSVLAVAVISNATGNRGVIGTLYTMPLQVWSKTMTASTTNVQPKLESGIIKDTRDLAITMNSFIQNAMMSVNAMGAFDGSQVTAGDPASAAAAANQAITSIKDRSADETAMMKSVSWIYQIGYLILLGFFMAYAGVIYFSAMTVVLGIVALPIALAFWAGGNSGGVKVIVTTWVTAILTVALAPPVMMIASNMALKQPTVYIKSQIDPMNAQARAAMQQYAVTYSNCANAHKDDWMLAGTATEFCSVSGNFGLFASSFGSAVVKILITFAIMILTMIVSLGVGAALIRAIPNILSSLLPGAVGAGGPDMSMARAASGMQQAARAMTSALSGGGALVGGMAKGSMDMATAGARAGVATGAAGGRAAAAAGGAVRSGAERANLAMQDRAVVNATTQRRNQQTATANAAREVAGLSPEKGTSPQEVRAQLSAAGALPSQAAATAKSRAAGENAALTAADAGAAKSYAASFNAGEQNRAITTPGYSPRTMTDQQAHSQLKTSGQLPSQGNQQFSSGNPMNPGAGERARSEAKRQGYGQEYRDDRMNGTDQKSLRKENDQRAASQQAQRDAGRPINGQGTINPAAGGAATPPAAQGPAPQKKVS
ncbi:conjugal transfer protein TrbL [Deinococcus soli (ex Cha et al. 2016)]|uniref:conjugal transfer protein TrbL n=1 Tax=Deinococcus soli (ex Cha et al. 2016) TaxID=1309411 RepID=UPI00166F3940|nr:conjugal transfer protein TrbL [Deinococcus soli (ex Cha et al. 2016)]